MKGGAFTDLRRRQETWSRTEEAGFRLGHVQITIGPPDGSSRPLGKRDWSSEKRFGLELKKKKITRIPVMRLHVRGWDVHTVTQGLYWDSSWPTAFSPEVQMEENTDANGLSRGCLGH